MPAGGGEQKQLQQIVKVQKIIKKKFIINPLSAVIFNPPPIEDIKLQLLEITKHAYKVGYGKGSGAEANIAKMLASEASGQAADMCMQTHGGFGFAEEFDIERKFRETRLYQVAPISTNLILSYIAEHILDLPRSY